MYQKGTQSQAKGDGWLKETQEKCPIEVILTTMRPDPPLFLSALVCLSTSTLPPLINTLLASPFSISRWRFTST